MANERLRELRTLMKVRHVDAYYVPSSDFHDSEYVEDYFKCRAFLSGFTGSAGTMVITQAFPACGRTEDISFRQRESWKVRTHV